MADRETLAVTFINAGRMDLAERLLHDQLKETPASANAHRLMAHSLRARKQLPQALTEAREGIRLGPDLPLCHLELGRVLRESKRYNEAEVALREATRLAPRESSIRASMSWLLLDRGSAKEAVNEARIGLQANPRNVDCLTALALALLQLHRIDEAHQVVHDALGDDPTRAHLHNNLGVSLLHRGELEAATVEFREALRLDPGSELAEANLKIATAPRTERYDPYPLRFSTFWGHLPPIRRASVVAVLTSLGFFWPGGWGAVTYPLALEAWRLAARGTPTRAAKIFWAVRFGALVIPFWLFLTLQSANWTATAAPPFWWSVSRHIATLPDPDVTYLLAGCQLLIGAVLMSIAVPTAVTRGWARAAALLIAAVGLAAALWTARPAAALEESVILLGTLVVSKVVAREVTLRVEKAGWTTSIRSTPNLD